jgi:two-component system, NtrC family, response regulator HydG
MTPASDVDTASIKAADIHVLIVDNEAAHAHTVAEGLQRVGFLCDVATSGTQGAQMIENGTYDVVITDLKMADIDGLELLKRTKQSLPAAEVILATGHGTVASAVSAMQQGAFNYLQKPLDMAQLRVVAEKAAESARLRKTNEELNRRLDEKYGFEGVVGSSPQMNAVIERLRRIAPTDATVLITGQTGTGKEVVARVIHYLSSRHDQTVFG